MGKLSHLFSAVAILLSDVMCAVVAFGYRDMLCGIRSTHVTAHLPAWHFSMPSRLASGSRYVPLSRTYFINGQVNK